MRKNSFLFLLPCSNTKEEGGTCVYNTTSSTLKYLSENIANKIYDGRRNCYNIIKTHQITRFGHRISDDDYNKHLIEGRDISIIALETEEASYLPAIQRYAGRIYSALGKERLQLANQTESHILIISGLYGILKPDELIQLYSLNVNDSPEIWRNWTRNDIITSALLEYIKKNNIMHLANLLSVRSYSQLINWDRLGKTDQLKIYHPFSTQFTGDTFHPVLGKYLRTFLQMKELELIKLFNEGVIREKSLVDLFIEPSLNPDNKDLLVESNEYTMLDQILRMEYNIRMIMEYHNVNRSDHTSEMIRDFYDKYGNKGLLRNLNKDFLYKRNNVVHELRDLSKEDWDVSLDTYLEFINWCDENIKPIDRFMLSPID